jgi:hypothetical protein
MTLDIAGGIILATIVLIIGVRLIWWSIKKTIALAITAILFTLVVGAAIVTWWVLFA